MEQNQHITISKEELAALPAAPCKGNIILVDKPELVEEASRILSNEKLIGFDTETKPSFRRGQNHKVSLLQLSTHSTCFLFRLNRIGMPESVCHILENPDIVKVGLSIHDDFHNLNKLREIDYQGFIDLQNFVKDYYISDNSLSRIYGILFNQRISKGQRLSNWEAEELTHFQQCYAALDAFACIDIYEYLKSGNFSPDDSAYIRTKEAL